MNDSNLIEVRIPMIVTADGKWSASGSSAAGGEPDWAWLDETCDYENPTVNPQRYWITVHVQAPQTLEVVGTVAEEE